MNDIKKVQPISIQYVPSTISTMFVFRSTNRLVSWHVRENVAFPFLHSHEQLRLLYVCLSVVGLLSVCCLSVVGPLVDPSLSDDRITQSVPMLKTVSQSKRLKWGRVSGFKRLISSFPFYPIFVRFNVSKTDWQNSIQAKFLSSKQICKRGQKLSSYKKKRKKKKKRALPLGTKLAGRK